MGEATAGLLVAVLFAVALGIPGLAAYRGTYRVWIYRGLATRYGALAVGWIAGGLFLLLVGIPLQEASGEVLNAVGTALSATGIVAILLGLVFFLWMPPQLVPRWRRELLSNTKLYRAGDRRARPRCDVTHLDDGRTVATWRRWAPVTDSEWLALATTAMHVRPRLRMPGMIRGPLPDRETGLTGPPPEPVSGELLVDADTGVFVQSPAEDRRHADNWFVVLPRQISADDITSGPDGTVIRVGELPGAGAIEIIVDGVEPGRLRRALAHARRPRRLRHTIDGQWRRADWTTANEH